MSTEENKTLSRRWFEEVINQQQLAVADDVLATDYVLHFPGLPGPVDGATHKQLLARFRAGFPDWTETVEDVSVEGDRVAARIAFGGTHRGGLMGLPATGRAVSVTGMAILRIAGGRIAEQWAEADMLGLLQQLGAIPTPGQPQG